MFKRSLFKNINPEIFEKTKMLKLTYKDNACRFTKKWSKHEELDKTKKTKNNFLPYFKQLMKNNQLLGPVFFEYFYFFYIFFDILKKEFGTFLTNYHQDLLPEFQKHSQQIEKFLNT